MRGVILAAGEGLRLRPLTENRPKHMIPIAGQPLLQHVIEAFKNSGVHKFTLVVGYLREAIEHYFSDGKALGVKIGYVHQQRIQGTADAVAQLEQQLEESRFLLCYGDVYVSPSAIAKVVDLFSDKSFDAAVAVVPVKDQEQYGMVKIEEGYVKDIQEKPKRRSSSNFANAGVYILERSIFDAVRSTARSSRGELELTDSMVNLIRRGAKVKPIPIDQDDWLDIGRPWDLLEANERALRVLKPTCDGETESNSVIMGPVTLRRGVKILSGSRIEGPTYIGEGSIIGPNCYIRPYTSVGQSVRVGNGCEIKNCIIMDYTKIPHQSYFGDSIVGEGCNFGAGTITGNLRLDEKTVRMNIRGRLVDSGRRKLGAIIGDEVNTGINVNLMPGVKVGSRTLIGPGITICRDLPSNVKVLMKQTATVKKTRAKPPDSNTASAAGSLNG